MSEENFIGMAEFQLPLDIDSARSDVRTINNDEEQRRDIVDYWYNQIMTYHKTEADQARAKLFVDNVIKFILENDQAMVAKAIRKELKDILKHLKEFADKVYHINHL